VFGKLELMREAAIQVFFSGPAFTSPPLPLSGWATKKITFVTASLRSLLGLNLTKNSCMLIISEVRKDLLQFGVLKQIVEWIRLKTKGYGRTELYVLGIGLL